MTNSTVRAAIACLLVNLFLAVPAGFAVDRGTYCNDCSAAQRKLAAKWAGVETGDVIFVFDIVNEVTEKFHFVWEPAEPPFIPEIHDAYGPASMEPEESAVYNTSFTNDLIEAQSVLTAQQKCGPGGTLGDWIVPDLWSGSACASHDICYGQGSDREACDDAFLADGVAACDSTYGTSPSTGRSSCLKQVYVYWVALRSAGWMFFTCSPTAPWCGTERDDDPLCEVAPWICSGGGGWDTLGPQQLVVQFLDHDLVTGLNEAVNLTVNH